MPDTEPNTVTRPDDHFNELLYVIVILGLMLFVTLMSHVHNDSLAAKGMDFIYIVLGALTQASTNRRM